MGEGIIVVFANQQDKVGVAVGVTNTLTKKYDAVKFVKLSSEIIGGKGGGAEKILLKLVVRIQKKLMKL